MSASTHRERELLDFLRAYIQQEGFPRTINDARALKPGSIVAAHVEGEGTPLKHFYLKAGRAILKPANDQFPDIEKDATRIQIQGVLVGVWREY